MSPRLTDALHAVDDTQQSDGATVERDKDDTLSALPQSVGPVTKSLDRQSKRGEVCRIADYDHMSVRRGACRQSEEFVVVATVECDNRHKRRFHHDWTIAATPGRSPSGCVDFFL